MNCKFCQRFLERVNNVLEVYKCFVCDVTFVIRNNQLVIQVYYFTNQHPYFKHYMKMELQTQITYIVHHHEIIRIPKVFPDTHPSQAEELAKRLTKLKAYL